MADLSYAQAVDALYRVLDMPAPLRPELEGGKHEIVFEAGDESVAIRLELAPNGRSVIVRAGNPPAFSADKAIQLEQMRQVLSTALGLSATNRACAGVEQAKDMQLPPRLAISARVPLSHSLAMVGSEMKAAVEDVMELLDWQSAHLKGGDGARGRGTGLSPAGNHFSSEELMVLRP